jgi:hypothetical protein
MPAKPPAATDAAAATPNALEELAERCVGDGQEPNLYFVIFEERCIAIFLEEEDAITFAENSDVDLVEDRAVGEVWASEEYEASREGEETEEETEEEEEEDEEPA